MLEVSGVLFYGLAAILLATSLFVVVLPNPIYSALSLVATMIVLSLVYYLLEAPFIAGVQLIVYAGAVTVLFVMVLMLFDLKKEKHAFVKGSFAGFLKVTACGLVGGLIFGAISAPKQILESIAVRAQEPVNAMVQVKNMGALIFTQYVFVFEILGLLLLLVAVGVVALARMEGGTHSES